MFRVVVVAPVAASISGGASVCVALCTIAVGCGALVGTTLRDHIGHWRLEIGKTRGKNVVVLRPRLLDERQPLKATHPTGGDAKESPHRAARTTTTAMASLAVASGTLAITNDVVVVVVGGGSSDWLTQTQTGSRGS